MTNQKIKRREQQGNFPFITANFKGQTSTKDGIIRPSIPLFLISGSIINRAAAMTDWLTGFFADA